MSLSVLILFCYVQFGTSLLHIRMSGGEGAVYTVPMFQEFM